MSFIFLTDLIIYKSRMDLNTISSNVNKKSKTKPKRLIKKLLSHKSTIQCNSDIAHKTNDVFRQKMFPLCNITPVKGGANKCNFNNFIEESPVTIKNNITSNIAHEFQPFCSTHKLDDIFKQPSVDNNHLNYLKTGHEMFNETFTLVNISKSIPCQSKACNPSLPVRCCSVGDFRKENTSTLTENVEPLNLLDFSIKDIPSTATQNDFDMKHSSDDHNLKSKTESTLPISNLNKIHCNILPIPAFNKSTLSQVTDSVLIDESDRSLLSCTQLIQDEAQKSLFRRVMSSDQTVNLMDIGESCLIDKSKSEGCDTFTYSRNEITKIYVDDSVQACKQNAQVENNLKISDAKSLDSNKTVLPSKVIDFYDQENKDMMTRTFNVNNIISCDTLNVTSLNNFYSADMEQLSILEQNEKLKMTDEGLLVNFECVFKDDAHLRKQCFTPTIPNKICSEFDVLASSATNIVDEQHTLQIAACGDLSYLFNSNLQQLTNDKLHTLNKLETVNIVNKNPAGFNCQKSVLDNCEFNGNGDHFLLTASDFPIYNNNNFLRSNQQIIDEVSNNIEKFSDKTSISDNNNSFLKIDAIENKCEISRIIKCASKNSDWPIERPTGMLMKSQNFQFFSEDFLSKTECLQNNQSSRNIDEIITNERFYKPDPECGIQCDKLISRDVILPEETISSSSKPDISSPEISFIPFNTPLLSISPSLSISILQPLNIESAMPNEILSSSEPLISSLEFLALAPDSLTSPEHLTSLPELSSRAPVTSLPKHLTSLPEPSSVEAFTCSPEYLTSIPKSITFSPEHLTSITVPLTSSPEHLCCLSEPLASSQEHLTCSSEPLAASQEPSTSYLNRATTSSLHFNSFTANSNFPVPCSTTADAKHATLRKFTLPLVKRAASCPVLGEMTTQRNLPPTKSGSLFFDTITQQVCVNSVCCKTSPLYQNTLSLSPNIILTSHEPESSLKTTSPSSKDQSISSQSLITTAPSMYVTAPCLKTTVPTLMVTAQSAENTTKYQNLNSLTLKLQIKSPLSVCSSSQSMTASRMSKLDISQAKKTTPSKKSSPPPEKSSLPSTSSSKDVTEPLHTPLLNNNGMNVSVTSTKVHTVHTSQTCCSPPKYYDEKRTVSPFVETNFSGLKNCSLSSDQLFQSSLDIVSKKQFNGAMNWTGSIDKQHDCIEEPLDIESYDMQRSELEESTLNLKFVSKRVSI